MLYIALTNEKIMHTNEYIEHGYGYEYGLPSPLMTSSHERSSHESCKPVIYLFHGGGAQINWSGPILISNQSINLCVSVFSPGSIDVY